MHQGPFPGSEFAVSNAWQGPVEGRWLLVYAGGPRDADGALTGGGVRVYTEPVDPNTGSEVTFVGEHPAPASAELTITDVRGHTMTLAQAGGGTVTFDLVTLAYVG
jgi:hypothetical protein